MKVNSFYEDIIETLKDKISIYQRLNSSLEKKLNTAKYALADITEMKDNETANRAAKALIEISNED